MQLSVTKLLLIFVVSSSTFIPSQSDPFESAIASVKETLSNAARQIRESFSSNNSTNNSINNSTNSPTTQTPTGPERVFYMEKNETGKVKKSRMIEVISLSQEVISCRVYGQQSSIESRLNRYSSSKPKYVERSEMQNVLTSCQNYFNNQLKPVDSNRTQSDNGTSKSEDDEEEKGIFEGIAIYPGTKWCGAGDVAENYDDLGSEAKPDVCCREHDHCNENIKAGESKYGLNNTNSYTSSSCQCDDKFHNCLREAKSFIGDQIGRTYFNVLRTQCFKKDHPIVNCTDEKGFLFNSVGTACQSYELDTSKPKIYQFFDAKFYEGQSGPLVKIPGISNVVDPVAKVVKNHTINGGLLGNLVG